MKKFLFIITLLMFYLPLTEAASNSGKGYRHGAIKNRTQTKTRSGTYVKRNTSNGRFIDQKTSSKTPFKGVRNEKY